MREIKFRGMASDGTWRFGGHHKDDDGNEYIIIGSYAHKQSIGCSFVKVIHGTVGQFTGLRDKNGKEIYEGDIYLSIYRAGGAGSIRGKQKERIKQVVSWDDRGRWGRKRIEQGHGYGCCHPNCELGEDIEVIGNIHENHELLNAR